MRARKKLRIVLLPAILVLSLVLAAGCGGGGGSVATDGGGSTPAGGVTVSGAAIKGPVANATVKAFAINPNGTIGAQIGTAMTDAQGNFSMQVGDHSGPMMLQMTG